MSALPEIFPKGALQSDYSKLYHAVALQIAKDFHPHVEMSEIPAELNSEWLYQEILRMLTEVIEGQGHSLGAILYRVDLSEKMVRPAMHRTEQSNKLAELAAMMLKREAQKVWIRHHYSG
jgi:hypothetical protein